MRRQALHVLGCPVCHGPLSPTDTREDDLRIGSLTCTNDHLQYPVSDGIPRLFRPDRLAAITQMAEEYSRVWRRDGWAPTSPENLRQLPYRDPSGGRDAKWRVKARSMEAVLPVLHSFPRGKVADVGAGTGWLSRILASHSLEVYAVDTLLDSVLGLGAAATQLQDRAPFECVGGELEYLPFRDDSLDAVVCNASLHYAGSMDRALSEVRRVLRAGGCLIVMNSPVHRDASSAARAERDFRQHLRDLGASEAVAGTYHHFVRERLIATLVAELGPTSETPYDPGWAFGAMRRAKGLALGIGLAQFPIFVTRKRPVETHGASPGDRGVQEGKGPNTDR